MLKYLPALEQKKVYKMKEKKTIRTDFAAKIEKECAVLNRKHKTDKWTFSSFTNHLYNKYFGGKKYD
jgi:hypothetical protein